MVFRLGEFTRTYHTALESGLDQYRRDNFQYHGDPTPIVQILKASDGYVTFYLTEPPGLPIPQEARGYHGLDYSQHTLNTICQSTTLRYLRVADANLGQPWDAFSPMPANVVYPADLKGNWFSSEVREAARSGSLTDVPLPGMMISPIVYVKNGIRTKISPSRVKIWSPTITIPGRGLTRLYDWTHADFWWFPEQLPLDASRAEQLARNDLVALQTVLNVVPDLTAEDAQRDLPTYAADILEASCDEFLALLQDNGDDEEALHQWLNKQEHHIFVDPHAIEVHSKVPFGNKQSDFVVRRPDQTYLLIEIERANLHIFQKRNAEPTHQFNHACQQVRDWQRYIRDNVHTVRTELGLDEIYEPRGMVIMGRTKDIREGDAMTRWLDMKNKYELDLATYDELNARVRSIAESLRKMLHIQL